MLKHHICTNPFLNQLGDATKNLQQNLALLHSDSKKIPNINIHIKLTLAYRVLEYAM